MFYTPIFLVASPPSDVTAVQDGPTSIRVSWTPPSPLGDTTGYRISYTGGGSADVDGGNTNSHTLTGLTNGQTYTISIVGTSSSSVLSSAPVSAGTVTLGKGVHSSHFIHTLIAIIHHAQLLCPATNVCVSHSPSSSNSTSSSLLLLRLQF